MYSSRKSLSSFLLKGPGRSIGFSPDPLPLNGIGNWWILRKNCGGALYKRFILGRRWGQLGELLAFLFIIFRNGGLRERDLSFRRSRMHETNQFNDHITTTVHLCGPKGSFPIAKDCKIKGRDGAYWRSLAMGRALFRGPPGSRAASRFRGWFLVASSWMLSEGKLMWCRLCRLM